MFEKYNESLEYSYVFGAFGTIKLLEDRPSICLSILIDSSFVTNEAYKKIYDYSKKYNIPLIVDNKTISRIRDKDNIFVVGVFKKIENNDKNNNKDIVILNENDPGKIGTIIRSMQGFEFYNIVLVNCDIDIYHYHLVRATMGSYFIMNIKKYDSIEKYIEDNNDKTFINISTIGDNIESINKKEDNISFIFSSIPINNNLIHHCKLDYNISIENLVNITLFTLYK